jgi:multicomponent Na+:H+ antiporter subunit E
MQIANSLVLFIIFKRFALFCALWLVLTGGDPEAWLVGLVGAIAATTISLRLLPPSDRRVLLLRTIALAPGFLAKSLRGGVDVAARVFQPRLRLRPGWASFPMRLPEGMARVSLGNEISLMPGTLPAGESDSRLFIHYLDLDQVSEQMVETEEGRIGEALGLNLERGHG